MFFNFGGNDVVTDFTSGQDVIIIRSNDANNLTHFVSQLTDLGEDMQFISATTGMTIVFQGVADASVFQVGDFVFLTT